MPLTIRYTPGYVWSVGETVTEDKLNLSANPTIELLGTISGQSIGDNSVTLAKLVVGILSADAAGRSRMADGYLILSKIAAGIFTADSAGRGKFANGFVNAALIEDGAVTAAKLAAGAVAGAAGGTNVVSTSRNDGHAVSSTIPYDDTPPQDSEGESILTQAITPKSAASVLVIEALVHTSSELDIVAVLALFKGGTASALAAAAFGYPGSHSGAQYERPQVLRHVMTAGTTSAITFTLRAGTNTGDVLYLNGRADTGRKFGGAEKSWLTITEYVA